MARLFIKQLAIWAFACERVTDKLLGSSAVSAQRKPPQETQNLVPHTVVCFTFTYVSRLSTKTGQNPRKKTHPGGIKFVTFFTSYPRLDTAKQTRCSSLFYTIKRCDPGSACARDSATQSSIVRLGQIDDCYSLHALGPIFKWLKTRRIDKKILVQIRQ